MKPRRSVIVLLSLVASFALGQSQSEEWSAVEKELGRGGKAQEGVYKVSFPRTDLAVRIGKTPVEASAGLGSWAAFRKDTSGGITDGDLVLLESEVNGVVSALQDHGLEVSAIHNHLLSEIPKVMYVHFFGRGDLSSLAAGIKAALATTKTPMVTARAASKPALGFDQKMVKGILGKPGNVSGKVLAFAFPRSYGISMHGVALPPGMGMATAINFQGAPGGVAATGDFVLKEPEVNGVISILRKGGVSVTAEHNHMLEDEPRTVFLHFWGEGKAEAVAKTLREAVDASK